MANIATTPPKAPEAPKAPVEAPPETPLPKAPPEPPKEKYPLKSEMFLRAQELYEEAVPEEYRKAQEKALMQIKPTRISREKMEAKALASQAEWGAASRRLMEEQGLPDVPDSYEDIHRQIFRLGLKPPEDWGGYSKDQFTLVNSYAQKNLNKDYGSAEEATEKFGSDFREHEFAKDRLKKQIDKSDTKFTLRGVVDGKEIGSVDRSGTRLDSEYAEQLPTSIEQMLYEVDLDLDVLQRATKGFQEGAKDGASLMAILPNEVDRVDYLQNATLARAPGRAKDLYVPFYQDTAGRRNRINITSLEHGLVSYYMREAARRQGSSISEFFGEDLEALREEARKRAKADVSRATMNSKAYTYHRDPTGAKRAFLEDEGVLGNLGRIRPLRPLLALFLDSREAGATLQQHGEVVENLAEEGFAAELLSDTSVTRAIDYYLRLAPSEAVGSAFSLAHKDYIDEFGDKGAGRGLWIAKRMFDLWGSDRLSSEIMNSMDGAGPLLTQMGSVMAGEYGDKYPMLFNVAGGISAFGLMLYEPDIFYATPMGLGKLYKGGVKGTKLLREAIYGADNYLVGSGKILKNQLQAIDMTRPDEVIQAVARAREQAKVELGTTDGIDYLEYLAASDTTNLQDIRHMGGEALRKAREDYLAAAETSASRYTELLTGVKDKASLKDPIQGRAFAERLQEVLNVAKADIHTRVKAYDVVQAEKTMYQTQEGVVKFLKRVRGDSKLAERHKTVEKLLSNYEVQKLAKRKNVDLQQLLSEIKVAKVSDIPGLLRRLEDLTLGAQKGTKGLEAALKAKIKATDLRLKAIKTADEKYLTQLTSGLGDSLKKLDENIRKALPAKEADATLAPLKQEVDGLRTVSEVLAKLTGEATPASAVTRMGPDFQKRLLQASDEYSNALARNANAFEALGTAEGKAFFDEMTTVGSKTTQDIKGLKTASAMQKRMEALGQTTLTEDEFLKGVMAADVSKKMWDAPARVYVRVPDFALNKLIQHAPFWMAFCESRVKLFLQRYPLLSRSARVIPIPVSKEIDTAVKGLTRRVTLWVKGVDMAIMYAGTDAKLADKMVQKLLTTNEMMEIPPKFQPKIGLGLVGPRVQPVRGTIIEPRGSGDKTIVRLLFENIQGRVLAEQKGEKINTEFFFDSLLGAFLKGAPDSMDDLRDQFLALMRTDLDAMRNMNDVDLLNTIRGKAITAITKLDLTPKISAKSELLFHRNVMQGAAQQLYNERLASILIFRSDEMDVARSMNSFLSEGKLIQDPFQGRPKVGELVVSRRTIEAWANIVKLEQVGGIGKVGADESEIHRVGRAVTRRRGGVDEVRGTDVGKDTEIGKGGDVTVTTRREAGMEQLLFDEGFGTSARRILRTEMRGKNEYAIFADGSAEKMADLSVLPPRLGILNAYDGFTRWGIELAADLGRSDDMLKAQGEARAGYCKLVAMSADAAGNPIMVPRAAIVQFTSSLDNLGKEFSELRSAAAGDDGVSAWAGRTAQKFLQWWRMSAVYGLIIPKPGHFSNNVVGDWVQMAVNPHIGFKAATQLSMFGAIGYLPGGRGMQDLWTDFAKKRQGRGVLLPPILGAMMNPALDDFFRGSKRNIKLKDGTTKTAGALWDEAVEAGVNESLRSYDRQTMIRQWVNAHEKAAEKALTLRPLANIEGGFFGIMSAVVDDASRRQRGALYYHLRINKGMSQEDATKILQEALYDWSFSISKAERKWLGSISAFYVFSKNAFGQTFTRLFDGADDSVKEYTKKWMKVQTTQQKIKGLTRFSDQIIGQGQYIPPGEIIPVEEQEGLAKRTRIPEWLKEYTLFNFGTLSPEARAIGEEAGVNSTNFVRVLPKLTSLEFANFYAETANLVLGVIAAGLSTQRDADMNKSAAFILDTLIDQLNPYTRSAVEDWRKGMEGGSPESMYGKPLKMDEYEMLSYTGLGGDLVEDKKRGILRASGSSLGLTRAFSSEERRARMFFTVLFPDTSITPTSIKMLAAQGYNPRLEAFAQITGIGKAYFYNADLEQEWKIKDIRQTLRDQTLFSHKVSNRDLNPK